MAEDTKPETSEPTTPEAKPETTILDAKPSLVNADGAFAENWRESLPDELKGEESLGVFKTLGDMARSYVNTKKLVGKNKIPVPNEKSTPEEWNAFWDASGRPKTADDYQVDIPEELAELYSKEVMQAARQLAYDNGASQQLFAAYMKFDMERTVQLLEEQERVEQEEVRKADEKLRQEFGGAYEERIHVANRLVAETLPNEEERMAFLEEFGKNPNFVRFASIVGARMVESKALIADLTKNTPAEARKRIEQLRATPGYMQINSAMTPDERSAITAEILELERQIYPAPQGAGR